MDREAYQLQGQNGGISISGAVTWSVATSGTPPGRWIQFLEDTVISAIDSNIVDLETTAGLVTFPAGTGFGGRTTLVTLTSGSIIIYY